MLHNKETDISGRRLHSAHRQRKLGGGNDRVTSGGGNLSRGRWPCRKTRMGAYLAMKVHTRLMKIIN